MFTKTLLSCSFEFDVLPCPIDRKRLGAAPAGGTECERMDVRAVVIRIGGTDAPGYDAHRVCPRERDANIVCRRGDAAVLQLAPTPQSPLAAFAQLSVQALATEGKTRKPIRPRLAATTASRRRAPRPRPRATVGSITISFESSRADRARQ